MSNFKALIADFDGTLVGLNFKPSSNVTHAIRSLVTKGYIVSMATGRPFQGMIKSTCQILNLSAPQIVKGGAEIIDPKTEKILWVEYLPADEARKIINHFLENNYLFSAESDEYVFTLGGETVKEYGPGIVFKDIESLDFNKVSKIVLRNAFLKNDFKKSAEKLIELYPNLNTIIAGLTNRPVLDITSKEVSKQKAVLKLSEMLNIDTSLMVGIGDGYNDLPLLSVCGFKIAMENAPIELKKIADLVVPTVENDGLIVAINKLLSR